MTDAELRTIVLDGLAAIAPELDPDALAADVDLRDQLDIDSMDFLRFVIGLDATVGVAVPETDYPRLLTLDGCVAYLRAALPQDA